MEHKQNVLIVHNYYQIPGGEDTVVANETKMLRNHGHKVILYTRNNSELNTMSIFSKLFFPFTTVFNIKTYWEIKQIIKREKIEIVHVHNTLSLISPSVYYAARNCNVRVVQTVHNFRLVCPGATFYRDGHICEDCIKRGLIQSIRHKCYRNSRWQTLACVINMKFHRMMGIYGYLNYICLTEFNKRKILSLKQINERKVYIKPNFVESKIKSIVSYEGRKNQFVFAGRLDKLKGIDILYRAWKELGNTAPKLIVLGTGPMEQWCKKYIKENNISNIDMKGHIDIENVKEIVSESKALILLTQWYEAFPMSIVEAYSVGTPVIGCNFGNVANIICQDVTGVKVNNSSEELIDAINKINKNNNIYNLTFSVYKDKYTEIKNYQQIYLIYNLCQNS